MNDVVKIVVTNPDGQVKTVVVNNGPKGQSGFSGYSGFSGRDGIASASGWSGYSGFSGQNGTIGVDGKSGYSGFSGQLGQSGYSGFSGVGGTAGSTGASGFSGQSGFSGFSGPAGPLFTDTVNVESYADFATAISTLGSAVKTLVIPSNQAVSSNVTVPSNITLLFIGSGALSPTAGHTVTIQGHMFVNPGLKQIFVCADTHPITFGIGSVPEVWCEWFGAKGDSSGTTGNGTDNTSPVTAAFKSLPPFWKAMPLRIGTGGFRFGSTVTMTSANDILAVKFIGACRTYSDNATTFFWDGNSTDPFLAIWNQHSMVDGISFLPSIVDDTTEKVCVAAIDLDKDPASPYSFTHIVVQNCSFGYQRTSGGITSGIRIGATNTSGNGEHMQFINNYFGNTFGLYGVYVPQVDGQVKDCYIERCSFYAPTGFKGDVCTFAFHHNIWEGPSCKLAISNLASDFIHITECDSEGVAQFLLTHSSAVIENSRFAPGVASSPSSFGGEWIYTQGGSSITLNNVHFDNTSGPNFYIMVQNGGMLKMRNVSLSNKDWDFRIRNAYGLNGGGSAVVLTEGCYIDDQTNSYQARIVDGVKIYGTDEFNNIWDSQTIAYEYETAGPQINLAAKVRFGGHFNLTMSGNINDLGLGSNYGIYNSAVIRITTGSSDYHLTGICTSDQDSRHSAIADGRIYVIENIGTTNSVILDNQSTSSAAPNRFLLPSSTFVIPPLTSAIVIYDETVQFWRLVGGGTSGYSGFSGGTGTAGTSGYSGFSGKSGYSGFSGPAGASTSGYSGFSGPPGSNGSAGSSGFSGYSGASGYSGFSGKSGYSGFSGANPGASGFSGFSGISGFSGSGGGGGMGWTKQGSADYTNLNAGQVIDLGPVSDGTIIYDFILVPSSDYNDSSTNISGAIGTYRLAPSATFVNVLAPPSMTAVNAVAGLGVPSDTLQAALGADYAGWMSVDSTNAFPTASIGYICPLVIKNSSDTGHIRFQAVGINQDATAGHIDVWILSQTVSL